MIVHSSKAVTTFNLLNTNTSSNSKWLKFLQASFFLRFMTSIGKKFTHSLDRIFMKCGIQQRRLELEKMGFKVGSHLSGNKIKFLSLLFIKWTKDIFLALGSAAGSIKRSLVRKFSPHVNTDTAPAEPNMKSVINTSKPRSQNLLKKSMARVHFDKQSNCNLHGNSTDSTGANVSSSSSSPSTQPDPVTEMVNRLSRTSVVNQNSAETNIIANVNNSSDNNSSMPVHSSETTAGSITHASSSNTISTTRQHSITAIETVYTTDSNGGIYRPIDAHHSESTTVPLKEVTFTTIAGQSIDNFVKDRTILGMNSKRKSNVVETPLSNPVGDRLSSKSVASSDLSGSGVNANTISIESNLSNLFMSAVSSVSSRQFNPAVEVRNIDSWNTGGSPEEIV
ncbi:unnamed protein product [Ambrosiozyma monospora]|uniref:Unnamed protein product n=1 Tax=Ambrosiozyma monospora TaxID=43982 RepID=A0ACB5T1K5_AMBMO|nr:unnamed protein product [Ambrosiozyma monospora]